jgi:hypothetical protein
VAVARALIQWEVPAAKQEATLSFLPPLALFSHLVAATGLAPVGKAVVSIFHLQTLVEAYPTQEVVDPWRVHLSFPSLQMAASPSLEVAESGPLEPPVAVVVLGCLAQALAVSG